MLISKFSNENAEENMEIFEDARQVTLPRELKAFLQKYNGGETPKTKFSLNGVSSDIAGFYGMGKVKYSYQSVDILDEGGQKYLPVAFDSFGNLILIALLVGSISFHDHETGKITKLADSLPDFIKCCSSDPVSPAAKKTVEEREADMVRRGRGSVVTDALRQMWQAEYEKYIGMEQEEVVF